MNNDTRQRLIDSIVRHYYSTDRKDLKVATVAQEAGITRQALHRYHSDLLGYIKGDKDVGNLLPANQPDSVSELLIIAQKRALDLENELTSIERRHKKALKFALDSHITTLMNNDITLFGADEVRISLEKQTALVDNYGGQITTLKAQLAKAQLNGNGSMLKSQQGMLISFEPKMHNALAAYKKDSDYNAYLEIKDKELNKITSKINAFTGETNLVIYLERYISEFNDFLKYLPPPRSAQIIVRIPLFTSLEVKNFVKRITVPGTKHVYIPEAPSRSEATAQRKFRAFSVPEEELTRAERSEALYLFKEINQVTYFTAISGK
ncbi:hypothetical protein [Pseudomonas coleopterorum]|uniref:Uncharacterized protein n=1 Tax=Pseudomonas coleopterorum TaxID=1605838 RepID=A0ABR9C2T5_9PSED|nr:hypothetical protein [Pseudomonas coleopterorum]MBD8755656.1 hypothetical protein [Pseudomonas coleopterorum]MBD8771636.1 hypothetical protein [Pseudomonas coleopterorum]